MADANSPPLTPMTRKLMKRMLVVEDDLKEIVESAASEYIIEIRIKKVSEKKNLEHELATEQFVEPEPLSEIIQDIVSESMPCSKAEPEVIPVPVKRLEVIIAPEQITEPEIDFDPYPEPEVSSDSDPESEVTVISDLIPKKEVVSEPVSKPGRVSEPMKKSKLNSEPVPNPEILHNFINNVYQKALNQVELMKAEENEVIEVIEPAELVSKPTEPELELTASLSDPVEILSESQREDIYKSSKASSEVVSKSLKAVTELLEQFTESSDMASKPPELVTKLSEVVSKSPDVVTESSEVVSEPSMMVSEPTVVSEGLDLVSEPSELVSELSEVISESFEVVSDPSDVVAKPSEVVSELTEVILALSKVLSEPSVVVLEPKEVASESTEVILAPLKVVSEPPVVVSETTEVVSKSSEVVTEPAQVIKESVAIKVDPTEVAEPALKKEQNEANSDSKGDDVVCKILFVCVKKKLEFTSLKKQSPPHDKENCHAESKHNVAEVKTEAASIYDEEICEEIEDIKIGVEVAMKTFVQNNVCSWVKIPTTLVHKSGKFSIVFIIAIFVVFYLFLDVLEKSQAPPIHHVSASKWFINEQGELERI